MTSAPLNPYLTLPPAVICSGDYALFSLESRAAARALAQRLSQGPRRYFGVNLIFIGTDEQDETLWVEMPPGSEWGRVMDPREAEANNRMVREKDRLRREQRALEQPPAGVQVQRCGQISGHRVFTRRG